MNNLVKWEDCCGKIGTILYVGGNHCYIETRLKLEEYKTIKKLIELALENVHTNNSNR